jgi:putative hydrolase of the HAD superfamily
MEILPKNRMYDTSIRQVFFDLDDTIIKSQEKYNSASRKCLNLLQEEFDLTAEQRRTMKMHLNAIEARRCVEMKKFSIHRFTHSWLEVYGDYCKSYKQSVKPEVKKQLREITATAWAPPFQLYEGVLETMRSLKTEFPIARVSILTLGDPKIQRAKLQSLPPEIRNYIDGIYVVESKSEKNFDRVLEGLNKDRCLMVGNSERSDIAPALAVGIKAIHIPNRSWSGDKKWIDKSHANYYTVPNFEGLKERIQEI